MAELIPEPVRDPVPPGPGERRAFVRYDFLSGQPVRFLSQPELRPGVGVLKDVSASGIGLLTDRPLAMGAVLVLRLPGRRAGGGRSRIALVTRVQPDGAGHWLDGCRLAVPLSDEEVRDLRRPAGLSVVRRQ